MQNQARGPVAHPLSVFTVGQVARACLCVCLGAASAQATAQTAVPTQALQEVTVKAQTPSADALPEAAPGGHVARGSRLGVLGNVDVMDAPMSTVSYTAEGIADTQATTVGAVLRHDPSVRTTTNEGHIVENFIVRGFSVDAGALAINGMYGLASRQSTPVEIFERVELIKGPSAMLMGLPPSGDVGGAINLVPKRAGDKPLTRLTTTLASQSNVQAHVDVARRLGEEQRVGVRFNGVLSGGETWLDGQTKSKRIGHLALDYRGEDSKLELDVYSMSNRVRKGSPMQVILNGWQTVPRAPDGSTNFFYGENVFSNTNDQGLILRGETRLAAGWTGYAALGASDNSYDGFLYGTRPVWAAADAATGNATGTAYNSWGEYSTRTLEAGLRGQWNTGAVAHRLTLAANLLQYKGGSRGNGTAPIRSNIYHPTPITMPAGAAASTFTYYNDDVLSALSAIDTLTMLQDRLQLTLGLRAQQVEQKLSGYKETAVTPMLGVVYKPWGETVSLYGNYVEGLSPGTTVGPTYANAGQSFAPYKSQQAELGVKWQQGALTQTVALFQITKPALIEVGKYQLPDGEQRNRGVEWTAAGRLADALSVWGGAAFTEAVQTRTAKGVNQGLNQLGVPRLTLNLGADWTVPGMPALVLTGRVNHTGSQWLTGDNKVKLPAATTLDVGARYSMRWGSQPVVLKAMVTNLANKAYFEGVWGAGRVNLGAPRAVSLAAQFDF